MTAFINGKSAADWKLTDIVNNLEPSAIREILKIASDPDVISFAGGLPAPEMFPLTDMSRIMPEVLSKYGSTSLQYSLTRGILPLREQIASRATARGSATKVENILITSGSQQGLQLIARAFINPGDYVLTGNPSYIGALQVFSYYDARYCTVDLDENGMNIEKVEEQINKCNPKFIYTIPDFQNPTGTSLSLERRYQLVEVAAKYNIPIVDDSPYGDLRFKGDRVPSIKSIGGDGVIALRTFSKLVVPGLRIGWINAHNSLLIPLERVKQATDLHSNTFGQYVLYEFVHQGLLEPHVQKICRDYKAKRDLMLRTMDETFSKSIKWTKPDGGLFLWVELPKGISTRELLVKALEKKIAYVPGQPFFPNKEGDNTLRLNFSNSTPEKIVMGITRLADLFNTAISNN
ncbi:MAG: PLP-dependent aminotransferase family protein [candidate division Zixibacteria bacterium]|nr:PLP-dependent aminotransferase family protein [candidate division Zixibacteria bacterium]